MQIQSLSIVVPNKACVNKCPFCVSRMVNSDIYPNKMDINDPHYDINVREYLKRLRYVASNGCDTIIFTGTSEPQQNKQFLATFALLHQQIGSPFTNLEMQTTGMFLTFNRDYLRFLRNFVGINTMALSVNSLNDEKNNEILGHGKGVENGVQLRMLCDNLKDYGFNIRLCFNVTDSMDNIGVLKDGFWDYCRESLHASQITFRKLYASDEETEQSKWIKEHESKGFLENVVGYIEMFAPKTLGQTIYGAKKYDINGMSVIVDNDCMGKNPPPDTLKYLILRPDCHLYAQWDSPSSIVF